MNPSYHRPDTIEEALRLKAELGDGAVFLAGGTEVNNRLVTRPSDLIDLAGLGLDTFEFSDSGSRIGAGATFQQLVAHPEVPWFVKVAAGQMANRNIRNRATVGGHLGLNRSCADLIPTLLAAQATVTLADRELPVEQFLAGESGLILSVFVPSTDRGFGLANMTRTAADVSLVAAAVSLAMDDGSVKEPIIAIGGVAPHAVRLHDVEKQLAGQPLPDRSDVEKLLAQAVSPIDDMRGGAAYKRHLAMVLGARALRDAAEQVLAAEGGN